MKPRIRFSCAASLCMAFVLAAAAPAAAQDVPPGHALYDEYCATCHGDDLTGGNNSSLIDGEWQFGSSRGGIVQSIAEGIPARGMPAFGDVLSDREVGQIADFIQRVAEGDSAATNDAPAAPDSLETLDYELDAEVFAHGLDVPWGIAFTGTRGALITERPGQLRVVEGGRLRPEPVAGTPGVLNQGQGGLLDVAVDPQYDENGWVYLSYSHHLPREDEKDPAMTRVVRGRIENNRWTDQQVLFEAPRDTYRRTRHHYGSRIVFGPEGLMYFSIGDRGAGKQAQDLSRPNGKVHRLHRDGSVPESNPFVDREGGALPSIFTYGHRNPQGLAVHPETGQIWESEHGPRGGDELNRLVAGRNYGWPAITYGINYDGTVLTEERRRPGMAQPVLYWRPSIAVSDIAFYRGERFPYWQGHLLVSALKFKEVRLLNMDGGRRVQHQQVMLKELGRVRDVAPGPDGTVYVVLNKPHRVLRLAPRKPES